MFSSCDLNAPAIVDFDTDSAAANGLEEGQYCFTLRVTDNLGGFDEDSFVVNILQEDHGEPSVDAGDDETIDLIHDGDPNTITEEDVELCSEGFHSLGCALTYAWSNGSAEECTVDDFSIANEPTCFSVIVTDTYGQESDDEVCVTVIEDNQAPVATFAVADTNHLVIEHNGIPNEGSTVVTLNGCGSDDPDNTIIDNPVDDIEFQWFNGGDGIDGATSCLYDTEPLDAGTYSYTLRVTDAYGAYGESTGGFTTSEANYPPVTNAGEDQTHELPHHCVESDGILTVTLDGLASSDLDGDIIADWVWENIDSGETVCDDIDELCDIELSTGSYSYILTITDIYGDSDTDTINVTVVQPNLAPIADAGGGTLTINEGETFTLDATGSSDPEECEMTYAWYCDGGYSATDMTLSSIEIVSNMEDHNPGGDYTCQVCVDDNFNEDESSTNCTSIVITVNNINETPEADAGPLSTTYQIPHDGDPEESYMVNLDCSLSSDGDQDTLTYTWSDESGNTVCAASGSSCTQIVGPGTYEYTCSINDGSGGMDSESIPPDPSLIEQVYSYVPGPTI
jgi:hypothetical protein